MIATLKCRNCEVNAQVGLDDEMITFIRCPACESEVSGDQANQMYREEARYLAETTALDAIIGEFMPFRSDFVTVTVEPGPAPNKPDWGFFLDPHA